MSAPSSSSRAATDIHAYSHLREGLHGSSQWIAHSIMPSSPAMDSASYNSPRNCDSALTSSPASRITGLPSTVSSSASSSRLLNVAISSSTNSSIYNNTCQHASSLLNPSSSSSISVTRSSAQSSTEPSVPIHSSNDVLNNNSSNRLRTSTKVFASTTDLAAHYGIPTTFPPPPSIQSRRPEPVTQPSPSHSIAFPDFFSLKDNYLNMLSQKSESTPAPSNIDMSSATVSPADLQQPIQADFDDIEGLLRTLAQEAAAQPDKSSPFELNDYLTSPWTPSLDAFGDSPGETPLSDFLNTPLISDDQDTAMFTGPLFGDSPLFGDAPEQAELSKPPALDTSGLLTLSPTSPNLETPSLDPAHLISPARAMTNSLPPAAPTSSAVDDVSSPALTATRRRSSATGTRKNVTVDSLVPLDAPTQSRRYLTPSATSKKDMPAVFARKRARQQMLDGEEDELDEPLKPNASELEQIEWKRRQNTLAARKSRKRKLQHQQELETRVQALTQEREMWRQRALMLQGMLQANGISFGGFQD
ncbi:Cross-pathway control protein 1 [Leucoagaricus sp. SymC.cos]|nr:Cross-pathway control protein 1 [Leucoagaricus sp. SymC.cos]